MKIKEGITLRDIYEVVNRLEDKIDDRITPIEKDISDLKSFQNRTLGIVGIVSIVLSGFSSYFWSKVTGPK